MDNEGMDQEEEILYAIACKTVSVLTSEEWAHLILKLGIDPRPILDAVLAVDAERGES